MRFSLFLSLLALTASAANAQTTANADVVVIVDTSTSMSRPGYDPERTSLLVAKLLTDIVPGQLAVVRVLDVAKDSQWIPSREVPGQEVNCSEDQTKKCTKVEAIGDWDSLVRSNKYGALARPSRGDSGFKQQLDGHLSQSINNSLFGLAFRAAQGVFDPHPAGAPRTVIWLSDGGVDDRNRLSNAVRELKEQGVAIEAIVFGKGTTEFVKEVGLTARMSRSPSELMKAFASAFRRIVQAPYEVDNLIRSNPTFEMKDKVGEAWVVAYGDDTLGDVTIDTPAGTQPATYARDQHPKAGAYRVYYTKNPPTGRWTVHSTGGGNGAAYAVVQRSALGPVFLEPHTATAGVPVTVKAGVGTPGSAQVLSGADLPEGVEIDLSVEGRNYTLNDEGKEGDQKAGDGIYSAIVTFEKQQRTPVSLRVRGTVIAGTINETVEVRGVFTYKGGPLTLDLGSIPLGGQGCREISLTPAEHTGAIPFELAVLNDLSRDLTLEVRAPAGNLRAKGPTVEIGPNEKLQVCLLASQMAPVSNAAGERWLEVRVAGSTEPDARVPVNLRWHVQGLSAFQRLFKQYGLPIAGGAALLATVLIGYGFIKPHRFQRNLALGFAATYDELDEAAPRPMTQWNVGPGWYRDARAYVHSSFKVNKDPAGALVCLLARGTHTEVQPGPGVELFREIGVGEWEPVPPEGRNSRPGDSYRVGKRGPFLRIAVKA